MGEAIFVCAPDVDAVGVLLYLLAAIGTILRYFEWDGVFGSEFGLDLDYLRDYFAGLFYYDGVTGADIKAVEFVEVVEACAFDGGACKFDGVEVGDGSESSSFTDLYFYRLDDCLGLLCGKLIRYAPFRCPAGSTATAPG